MVVVGVAVAPVEAPLAGAPTAASAGNIFIQIRNTVIIRWRRLWTHLSHVGLGARKGRPDGSDDNYPSHLAWRSMEALLMLLDCLYLPEIALWIHQIFKPNTRRLYPDEIEMARSIFGESIDYQKVRIDGHARIGCRKYHFAYVSFQMINTWGLLSDRHFIHEMVHIWQYQRLGSVYIPRALYAQRTAQGYNYGGIAGLRAAAEQGRGLSDFNFEQQGDVVADYFCLLRGYAPLWCVGEVGYLVDFERVIRIPPLIPPPKGRGT